MTVQAQIDLAGEAHELQPFALKDAPALIEAVFPAQKVAFEVQREGKAMSPRRILPLVTVLIYHPGKPDAP